MKQTENSNRNFSDNLDNRVSRPNGDKNSQTNLSKSKIVKISFVSLALALIVTVYLLANKGLSEDKEREKISNITLQKIEVEVLDGVGSTKAALYLTDVIRSYGYDVVEMKRNNTGVVDKSYIFDRSGNLDEALKLADAIGIPHDKVFQKIDKNLFLDITVVLGKDFLKLKAFQSHSERNKH